MAQSPQQRDDSARNRPSALAQLLKSLARKGRSEAALRAELRSSGHTAVDIDDAIERAQGYGYVHDGRLADSVAHAARRRGKGPLWVQMQLAARALGGAAAEQAVTQSTLAADETADAVLAAKFGRLPHPLAAKEVARAQRFLVARGFSAACAYGALDRLRRKNSPP